MVPSGPTGALGVQKFYLLRFRSRACRFRTNGTGANSGGRMLCAPTGFRWTVGAAISRPQAFPFRGRCPRRGRMRCAAKGRLRAGQCPAPTGFTRKIA